MAKAVLFDLFGTLVAYDGIEAGTLKGWTAIYQALALQGLEWPYEAFAPEWERQFNTPLDLRDDCDASLFVGKLVRLQRSLGLAADLTVARTAAEACLAAWSEHVCLPDDVLPTLRALRPAHALALVTNFDHPTHVHALLEQYALSSWFDAIIISAELRIDKPDPRIFEHALRAVGVQANEALMVGDSVSADMAGADAVGCQPVLIDRLGWHPSYQGRRIETLSDLLDLV
ncbi:MAG: HAD family hydrolase [Chloroflexi bacterium]|nr:HAD family hydrolase [Chloroflexota bacterium]